MSTQQQNVQLLGTYLAALNRAADDSRSITGRVSALRQFSTFCRAYARSALPADPETVRVFVVVLGRAGYAVKTIHNMVRAISQEHRHAGLPDPTDTPVVKAEVRAAASIVGAWPARRAAVESLEVLRRRVVLGPPNASHVDACAVLIQAAQGDPEIVGRLFRVSPHDVVLRSDGDLDVLVRQRKGEQPRHVLHIRVGDHPDLCGVRLLLAWLAAARPGRYVGRPFAGAGGIMGRIPNGLRSDLSATLVELAPSRKLPELRNRAAAALLVDSGLRPGELCRLNDRDWLPSRARGLYEVRIHNSKRRLLRVVPVAEVPSDPACPVFMVETYRKFRGERRPEDPLLWVHGRTGGPRVSASFMGDKLRQMLIDALGASRAFSAYTFRRSFATALLEAGTDLPVIASLLGHSDLSTTAGYLELSSATFAGEANRMIVATIRTDLTG